MDERVPEIDQEREVLVGEGPFVIGCCGENPSSQRELTFDRGTGLLQLFHKRGEGSKVRAGLNIKLVDQVRELVNESFQRSCRKNYRRESVRLTPYSQPRRFSDPLASIFRVIE